MSTSPLSYNVDLDHGGRWTSLRTPTKEWLWTNPPVAAQRRTVSPGDDFVDAGGGEECFPCVREPYDHGLVWSRPWQGDAERARVEADGYSLARSISHDGDAVVARYRAEAVTERPMIHATHLLVDISPAAQLLPSGHTGVRFFDPAPRDEIAAAGGEEAFVARIGAGGPSAVCYGLTDCCSVKLVDGQHELELSLRAAAPHGFVIWRNLMGWPEDNPYRSIGIEPAIGHGLSLPGEGPTDTVTVGPDRTVEWELRIEARG